MREFRAMKRTAIVTTFAALLIGALAFGIQRNTGVVNIKTLRTSPFSEERAGRDLQKIVGFGPRPSGSEAIAKTQAYITSELTAAGLKPELDRFQVQTPRGIRQMVNIRAKRPGANPSTIAITGHYDTKLFDNMKFVGASDGGSSAAWLLEFARATRDLKLQNTLEFIFFDGEEAVVEWTDTDSVYGSRHDVQTRNLKDLKALILVDMIGDKNLNIKREIQSTRWLKDIIWNTAHSLGYMKEFQDDEIEISDDHVPYLRAGVPSVDLIDFDYPPWHRETDTLDKVSAHSLKIVGDVVYFSLPEIDQRR
jgi:glutaminyl-peptide cyclotransferase